MTKCKLKTNKQTKCFSVFYFFFYEKYLTSMVFNIFLVKRDKIAIKTSTSKELSK